MKDGESSLPGLDLGLQEVDGVRRLQLDGDDPAIEGVHEHLHSGAGGRPARCAVRRAQNGGTLAVPLKDRVHGHAALQVHWRVAGICLFRSQLERQRAALLPSGAPSRAALKFGVLFTGVSACRPTMYSE